MGGGGKSSKAPKTPDYSALAAQQGQINQQAAQQLTEANRPNQYDAFGNSITWNQTQSPEYAQAQAVVDDYKKSMASHPNWNQKQAQAQLATYQAAADKAKDSGTWEQHQNLSPETKAAWDKYNSDASAASSKYGDLLNSYMSNYKSPTGNADFAGGPQMGAFSSSAGQISPFSSSAGKINPFSSSAQNVLGYNDSQFNGDNVANALYDSVMTRARPEQAREQASIDSQLKLQGLQPGTEAYDRSMKNLMTSQGDSNLLASQNAVLAGANEGRAKYSSYLSGNQSQFGNDVGAYNSNLAGQAQQFGQDLSGYNANLNSQSQQFGQDLSGYQANMGANAQNYQQNSNTYSQNAQNYQMNRNQPLQELSGLAGIAGGQPYSPTYSSFSAASGYNPTDLLGAAQATQAANQQKSNASAGKKSGMLGSATSLGGSYLGSK